jgi:hypothetical protein
MEDTQYASADIAIGKARGDQDEQCSMAGAKAM